MTPPGCETGRPPEGQPQYLTAAHTDNISVTAGETPHSCCDGVNTNGNIRIGIHLLYFSSGFQKKIDSNIRKMFEMLLENCTRSQKGSIVRPK